MMKAVVSGSFHRHMREIYDAVGEFRAAGVDVLSPSDPRVVDHIGDFLFVASDRLRAIKTVQSRHFEAIRYCDLLWIASPDGYTGESTSGEIGAAIVLGVPVFAPSQPINSTWQEFVNVVGSVKEAIATAAATRRPRPASDRSLILDPAGAFDAIAAAAESSVGILSGSVHLAPGEAKRRLAKDANLIVESVAAFSS